jgi:hypothetical protein
MIVNNVDLGEGKLKKSLRFLIVLGLVVGSLFFGHSEKAHAAEGLTAEVYSVQGQNGSPYIPQGMSPTLVTTVPNIDFQWGGGSVLGGPAEDVIVRFTGSILSNTTQEISFLATADDGTKLYIDNVLVADDWRDKGGGGTTTDPISFTAGVPKTIELMYYENGGGANVFLHWDQSGSMDIIPSSAFTSQAAPIVNTIGAPRNLTVVDGETSTVLTWEAPNSGNTQPERYAIGLNTAGQNGWGIATGNVGGPNSLNTTITISHSLLESLMPSGTVWSFHIRSDNDTLPLYSENSNVVTLKIGKTTEEIAAEEAIRLATEAAAAQAALDAAAATQAAADAQAAAEAAIAAQVAAQAAAQQAEAARIEAETAALIAQQAAAAQAEANRLAAIAAANAEANRIAAELAAKLAQEAAEMAEEAARIQAEIDANAEADRIAAELEAIEAQIRAEAQAEADRIAQEEADAQEEANAQAEADRIAAEQEAMEQEIENAKAEAEAAIAEEEAEIAEKLAEIAEAEAIEAEEEKAAEEELKEILEEAKDGKELTEEQKEVLVEVLLKDLKPGESISAEQVKASGVSYADLPPETPIEVRTDENGNALIITAEVAANVELVQDPGALLTAAFTDPGAALAALGSIGADMTEEEREEATDMVVATVVATGAAINAAAVAAGGATGGSSSGGSSGGGGGANSPGSRGGRRW